MNYLYYGDCFSIMQEWPNACIDPSTATQGA